MKAMPRILSCIFVLTVASFAQQPPAAVTHGEFNIALPPPAPGAGAVPNFTFIASEFSFEGAVVKNAPYSAEAVTETTQRLADGNRIARKNTAKLYRDSQGRTRREEALGAIGPWASNAEPVRTIFINDPAAKTHMVLNPQDKTVRKMQIGDPNGLPMPLPLPGGGPQMTVRGDVVRHVEVRRAEAGAPAAVGVAGIRAAAPAIAAFGGIAPGGEKVAEEPLGTRIIEGVRAEGTRTVVTIPAGAIGNDLPIEIESERWYSPELQTVIMTRHNDPRMGETTYQLTGISRAEPAPSLFEAPPDYNVLTEDQIGPQRIEMKMIERRKN
jgi:hypothetical protein